MVLWVSNVDYRATVFSSVNTSVITGVDVGTCVSMGTDAVQVWVQRHYRCRCGTEIDINTSMSAQNADIGMRYG